MFGRYKNFIFGISNSSIPFGNKWDFKFIIIKYNRTIENTELDACKNRSCLLKGKPNKYIQKGDSHGISNTSSSIKN